MQRCETSMKSEQTTAASFFNNLSNAKEWSEILSTLTTASTRSTTEIDAEIGWIGGRVHETRSTQKEVEILLVRPQESGDGADAIRVYINCPQFARFVFAINQHIKISLNGARIIHELVPHGSGLLPFSLVFSSTMTIQSVRGGVCMPDGVVVDSRRVQDYCGECLCLESSASRLSLEDITAFDSTQSSFDWTTDEPSQAGALTPIPLNNTTDNIHDEFTTFPALSTLTEGMMTPLLGIVETAKSPSTTCTGELCVSITLADASSYEAGRGFRVTCFSSKMRLARELPCPAVGDAILFKAVKVCKWSAGIYGAVYQNKLDWISYHPATETISLPRHAKSEPLDAFYEDVEQRKELFKHFIAAINSESGPLVQQ